MLNQIVLVGRIVEDPTLEEGKGKMTIAVQRSFKNAEGEYETDFIPVTLWNGVAQNVTEYCKKGDIVGIKGRIQRYNSNEFTANGLPIIEIVADKVTFLTSKKTEEE